MPLSRKSLAGAIAWVGLCLVILAQTEPWRGGEDGLSFGFLLVGLTFPIGIAGAALFALVTYLTIGSAFENAMCCTALWWSSYFAIPLTLGYVQWFVALPALWRVIRRRLRNANALRSKPAGHGDA